MEKAFDRLWMKGLVTNHLSSIKTIKDGVSQGSCSSSLPDVLYINDFPPIPQVKLSLFPDDTMFMEQIKTQITQLYAYENKLT